MRSPPLPPRPRLEGYDDVLKDATQALENNGFTVQGYGAVVDEVRERYEEDVESMLAGVEQDLSDAILVRIQVTEPTNEYGEPAYFTRIEYKPHDDTGYFTVRTDAVDIPDDQEDRWKAMLERALIDAGLPVMIGNTVHEDNTIAGTDLYY